MLTRNYRTLLLLFSFAGGDSSEEPTSIFAGIWKFTAQLRESRSGELEFWLYRYLTAVAPYSDDILSEVEELPPAVAVTRLFNWEVSLRRRWIPPRMPRGIASPARCFF